ncbi:MAG: hypothetical protein H0T10_06000 [Actinobacteria bacterium]|nr:hypothetical protein [Actinomycetota bacterium]
MAALTVVDHIEAATDLVREVVANGAFTPTAMRQVDEGVAALRTELRFARAMGGNEGFGA